MKVALVFPPQGHFTQPYLSLPSLAAYLRTNGVEQVEQIDANIEAYDYFLTEARMNLALGRIDAGGGVAGLDGAGGLGFTQMERYQLLTEIDLAGSEVAARVEEAKEVLRTPELFYDHERYLWAGRTVERALRILSAEYWPTRLTAHNFVMRKRIESSAEIVAATADERENPYVEYFREFTLPRLRALDPDLVGISITFGAQAIPALTLARQIREWKPDCHITVGGGLLAYVGQKLSRRPETWELIDSMVMLEGERPLLEICRAVDEGRGVAGIGNVIHRCATGEVVEEPEAQPLNIQELPTPDFDGLPLEKYLSPELVLPLACTRGCYWGKCVFCTLHTVIGPGYRGRGIDQTVEDLAKLSEKYGTKHFYLAIEDLPPNMARALPRKIIEAGLDIDWWCDARLEHDVFDEQVCEDLAASGCRRIAFGYESSSQRVLDKMCKGIDPQASLELMQRVHDAGISITLYVMIGFPTETLEEARETLATVLRQRDIVQEVSARVFYLDESSEVYKRRSEFDIAEVFPDPTADLQVYYDFRANSGMSRREARDLYLEFTRALQSHFPVFQNTNMLYHELKSHYFLYLNHFGSWGALLENVLVGEADPSGRPLRAAHTLERELRFDRAVVDERLTSLDSETLRPRYQSDLIEDTDRERLDAELEPLAPFPSHLVYDVRSGELHCLSPGARDLLERCSGGRSPEEVAAYVPSEQRAAALECIAELMRTGLARPARNPQRTTKIEEVLS
ncbi:MAG: hypothetical protein CMJ84_02285 [Planctomycetes bacterium]|jgi:radical SAM superfamily enzyme YgiQ (UPF0313 family)|nr:hypothetical protein [Planctomycetota bacterium]MDP6408434.1 radical SAM protein [Planctomycetota bacterium]